MNVLIDKSQKLKADDNQQNRFYGLFDRDQMDRKRPLATCLFLVTKVWMVKRHHQIRAQLSKTGVPIKGDLKYGSSRSNPDGGINLHARKLEFIHPVTKENIEIIAPVPQNDAVWRACEE